MILSIVYYIYVNKNTNWKIIVDGQIEDIINNDLHNNKIYFVICSNNQENNLECISFIETKNLPFKDFTTTIENNFEYPGLLKLYQLGKEFPDDYFFYMHSKGMCFSNNNQRNCVEKLILQNTIKYPKYIKYLFEELKVDKAGLFPDTTGIVWYNFFWISGKFLNTIKEPVVSTNRYYYETGVINGGNCFNLVSYNFEKFDQCIACKCFKILKRKLYFDSRYYLSKYPDLVKNGITLKYAQNHFITHGINEYRNLI